MADGTKIEWADATWNVVNGCSVVSPGCTNCYAMRLAGTRLKHHASRAGLTIDTKAGPVWTGKTRFNQAVLLDPLKWRRPRRIFVCAHGDLFHDSVPDDVIDAVFAVMALAKHHQFQVLTKRSERMREYLSDYDVRAGWILAAMKVVPNYIDSDRCITRPGLPLPNVWLGVSVEDQARADERIPVLLATPAALRWLSCEPLLGPLNLNHIREEFAQSVKVESALNGKRFDEWGGGPDIEGCPKIDWVVAGGESGRGARPMHPDWARSLRDQCAHAGVPFLFKQWGSWEPADGDGDTAHVHQWVVPPGSDRFGPINLTTDVLMRMVGKKAAGRRLDGQLHDGFPA